MNITGNMALTIWDKLTDDFDYGELEDNWVAVDTHDHSPERGVQIGSAGIRSQAITQGLIATGAVGNAQLQAGSVGTSTLQDGSVTTTKIASGAITGGDLAAGTITVDKLDPNLIPLGDVQMWWRPPGSSNLPGGPWEIMDGRPWSGITNAWGLTTGNIPDMRGHFAQGADVYASAGPGIGVGGGSNTANLAHTHTVDGHAHTVGPHQHGIVADGGHAHTFLGGLGVWSRQNVISPNILYIAGYPGNFEIDVSYYSMYLQGLQTRAPFNALPSPGEVIGEYDAATPMDNAGTHSHGGATNANGNFLTSYENTGTTSALGNTELAPPNVGLLFIMRVR